MFSSSASASSASSSSSATASSSVPMRKSTKKPGNGDMELIHDVRKLSACMTSNFIHVLKFLMPLIRECVSNYNGNRSDIYAELEGIFHYMKNSKTEIRFLYQPLLFIKQHNNLLRHTGDCRTVDMKKNLGYIGDIIVWLRLKKESEEIISAFITFYNEYHEIATETCGKILPREDFSVADSEPKAKGKKKDKTVKKYDDTLASACKDTHTDINDVITGIQNMELKESKAESEVKMEPVVEAKTETVKKTLSMNPNAEPIVWTPTEFVEPLLRDPIPSGHTVHWYKTNGYSDFLKTRTVVFREGAIAGKRCTICKYNGNNLLVSFTDENGAEVVKYVSKYITIDWY